MKRIFFALTTLIMVCSCSVYKVFKSPEPKTANLCGENRTTQDSLGNLPAWKDVFTDSLLQQLIEKGLMVNTDLQVARLNIEQAEAKLLASKLAYLPSFAVTPEGSISKGKDGETVKSYNLPLTMQWEKSCASRWWRPVWIARLPICSRRLRPTLSTSTT